jgi:hypothetical protein
MGRLILICLACLLLAGVYKVGYFFTHGYKNNLSLTYNYIDGTYTTPTPQETLDCARKQAEAKALKAPLKAEAQDIAVTLTTSPLPLDNGEKLYEQYETLQRRIDTISNKYSCH